MSDLLSYIVSRISVLMLIWFSFVSGRNVLVLFGRLLHWSASASVRIGFQLNCLAARSRQENALMPSSFCWLLSRARSHLREPQGPDLHAGRHSNADFLLCLAQVDLFSHEMPQICVQNVSIFWHPTLKGTESGSIGWDNGRAIFLFNYDCVAEFCQHIKIF